MTRSGLTQEWRASAAVSTCRSNQHADRDFNHATVVWSAMLGHLENDIPEQVLLLIEKLFQAVPGTAEDLWPAVP